MPLNFPYFGETEVLNETARATAPGMFTLLTSGYTHFELGGLENSKPVVLVHGFSVPYFIWDPTFDFLTKSGFHVLRYDLYGRGHSDRPQTRYDIDLFCKQLRELLEALDLEKVSLVSLSMGGPIAATFASRYHEKVRRLVLVDPAGARPVTLSVMLKAATTPGFGELALGLFGRGQMVKGLESDFYDPAHVKAFVKKYMLQTKYKGFIRALLSTMRNGMLGDFSSTYEQIGWLGIPTLLLWGRNDKTVPFEHHADICAAIPQTEFHAIDDCAHIPHYEKPDEVNPILLEFLK